jgi:hypothetical protein
MPGTVKRFQTMPQATDAGQAAPTPPTSQPSALPPSIDASNSSSTNTHEHTTSDQPSSATSKVVPPRKPLLRLELRDLSSDGSRAFLRLVHASSALQDAVNAVLKLLYKDMHVSCIPPTRSVTLVLEDMDGVAYTTGRAIDNDHKEIHLSTKYIVMVPESRQKEEILGVLVHEMVHCWQHSGYGAAPGGLIEGIADWVRLKAGYAPPHWKRHTDCEWDAGYERTGYFLEWLEDEHGSDVVRRINEALRDCEYNAEQVWNGCCGKGVQELWEEYKKCLEEPEESERKYMKSKEGNKKIKEGYMKTEEAYRKIKEEYKKIEEEYKKIEEEYDDDEGAFKENEEVFKKTEEAYKKTEEAHKKIEQQYKKIEEQYKKIEEEPEMKAEDNAHASVGNGRHPTPEDDTRTAREKARRGGNMHIPIRPGASS